MSNTLYTQLVHMCATVGVIVLLALGRIEVTVGMAALFGLVGIALPSPFPPAVDAPKPPA